MSKVKLLLGRQIDVDLSTAERFLVDLERVADWRDDNKLDISNTKVIDGLMVCYSRSYGDGVRRLQDRRSREG